MGYGLQRTTSGGTKTLPQTNVFALVAACMCTCPMPANAGLIVATLGCVYCTANVNNS